MGNGREIIGIPLHPIQKGDVLLVDGRMGNPVFLNDDRAFKPEGFEGGTFYLLVAAEKGRTASEVAQSLRGRHRLSIRPFVPAAGTGSPLFDLFIRPEESYHYRDKRIEDELHFRPDLKHLTALYGENADYYMIACQLPNDREALFGRDFRTVPGAVRSAPGVPIENINVRKFDLIQTTTDYQVEALHRGGLVLFDRQDPDGVPDDLRFATLSDLHYARRNDDYEKRAVVLRDRTIFLKINNPNANLAEAIVPWINEQYRQGRIDGVVLLGDNVDFDGLSHEASKRLTDSNTYFLARVVDRIEPPVLITAGNHEVLPNESAAELTRKNFQLSRPEIRRLQDSRFNGPGIPIVGSVIGFGRQMIDGARAIVNDVNSMIPYYDLFNPFEDTLFRLGRGDPGDPNSKETAFFFLNKGGADIAHWRQDDPIYPSELQTWPFQHPYVHPVTTQQAISDAAPDVVGLSIEARTWLHAQISRRNANITLFQHPPALNNIAHNEGFDPGRKATPFIPVDPLEQLDENATAHGAQENDMVAKNPNVHFILGGHTHDDGNTYARWIDADGDVQVARGPFREVLSRISPRDRKNIRCFWHPEEGLEGCSPEIRTLFDGLKGPIRNFQLTYQIGAAGAGKHPVFSVTTLTPDGEWVGEEHHYVNKVLVPEGPADGSTRYRVRRVVADRSEASDRLPAAWKEILSKDRRARLDMEERLPEIDERLRTDDLSFAPHLASFNKYPRYDDSIRHPFIDEWKVDDHLGLRATVAADGTAGLTARYSFSQDQIGILPRSILLEGVETATWRDADGAWHLSGAVAAPTFQQINWKVNDRWRLRGLKTKIGAEGLLPTGRRQGDASLLLDLDLVEVSRHYDSGFEVSCGLTRHGLHRGDLLDRGAWWLTCGFDF